MVLSLSGSESVIIRNSPASEDYAYYQHYLEELVGQLFIRMREASPAGMSLDALRKLPVNDRLLEGPFFSSLEYHLYTQLLAENRIVNFAQTDENSKVFSAVKDILAQRREMGAPATLETLLEVISPSIEDKREEVTSSWLECIPEEDEEKSPIASAAIRASSPHLSQTSTVTPVSLQTNSISQDFVTPTSLHSDPILPGSTAEDTSISVSSVPHSEHFSDDLSEYEAVLDGFSASADELERLLQAAERAIPDEVEGLLKTLLSKEKPQ